CESLRLVQQLTRIGLHETNTRGQWAQESVENESRHLCDPAKSNLRIDPRLQTRPEISRQTTALNKRHGILLDELGYLRRRRFLRQSNDAPRKTHEEFSEVSKQLVTIRMRTWQFEQDSRGLLSAQLCQGFFHG